MSGVERRLGPPKSWGYLNIRKKYMWPIRIPHSSITPPPVNENLVEREKLFQNNLPEIIKLNPKSTQGRYIALN